MRREDMTGRKFGLLTVVRPDPDAKNWKTKWICQCDCGSVRSVYTYNLKNGHTKSCGCESARKRLAARTTHNKSKTRLYRIWAKMKARCTYPGDRAYNEYGGRGITVCDEWLSFEPFESWSVCNGYSSELTLDRVNNDLGYSPDNCRWATPKQQANNTRKNRVIEYNGISRTLAEWANVTGIRSATIAHRLNVGWSVEDALRKEVRKHVS